MMTELSVVECIVVSQLASDLAEVRDAENITEEQSAVIANAITLITKMAGKDTSLDEAAKELFTEQQDNEL